MATTTVMVGVDITEDYVIKADICGMDYEEWETLLGGAVPDSSNDKPERVVSLWAALPRALKKIQSNLEVVFVGDDVDDGVYVGIVLQQIKKPKASTLPDVEILNAAKVCVDDCLSVFANEVLKISNKKFKSAQVFVIHQG